MKGYGGTKLILKFFKEGNGNISYVYKQYDRYCKETNTKIKSSSFETKCRIVRQKYKLLERKELKDEIPSVPYENLTNDYSNKLEKKLNDKKSEMNLICTSSDIKTIDELLDFAEIDTDIWEVKEQLVNKWGNEDNPNYQVKAKLKKKEQKINIEEIKKDFINSIKDYKIPRSMPTYIMKKKSSLLEVSIFDHHMGRLVLDNPEGYILYNPKIASDLMLSSISYFLNQVDKKEIERILFPIGQDFFNVDNLFYTTTKGTKQDEMPSWKYTFIEGRKLLVNAVNYLREVAPVDIVVVQGNHDAERIFYLGDVIEAWFKDDPYTTVDNSFNKTGNRKYYRYGKNLIGLTHGSEETKNSLPMLMALECPKDWERTIFREWHKGHLHHSSTKEVKLSDEIRSVREKIIPSLVASDDWHNRKGYKSIRESVAMIWDKNKGKITEHYFHV